MQSRAFLSQLLVTGDESGFFYALLQRYSFCGENLFLTTHLLSEIVKRLLEFCNVSVRDKTPKMLRKTYALFLNNLNKTYRLF